LTATATTTKGRYKIELVALPSRALTLFLNDKGAAEAHILINGKDCVLNRIYVHAVDRTLRLPKVEFVELFGTDATSGEAAYEKFVPS
jgi:hypothetical protein